MPKDTLGVPPELVFPCCLMCLAEFDGNSIFSLSLSLSLSPCHPITRSLSHTLGLVSVWSGLVGTGLFSVWSGLVSVGSGLLWSGTGLNLLWSGRCLIESSDCCPILI
jgi:hypothetical protein